MYIVPIPVEDLYIFATAVYSKSGSFNTKTSNYGCLCDKHVFTFFFSQLVDWMKGKVFTCDITLLNIRSMDGTSGLEYKHIVL